MRGDTGDGLSHGQVFFPAATNTEGYYPASSQLEVRGRRTRNDDNRRRVVILWRGTSNFPVSVQIVFQCQNGGEIDWREGKFDRPFAKIYWRLSKIW
jgi:hypothetical protein